MDVNAITVLFCWLDPLITRPGQSLVVNSSGLLVSSDVVLEPGSSLTISGGGSLNSTGSVVLDGVILVVQNASSSGTMTVVAASSITGTFSSVSATPSCQDGTATVAQTSVSAASVVLTIEVSCGSDTTKIVIGSVVGGVIVLATIAVIFGVLMSKHKHNSAMQDVRMKMGGHDYNRMN
jgi:hypothetical protein